MLALQIGLVQQSSPLGNPLCREILRPRPGDHRKRRQMFSCQSQGCLGQFRCIALPPRAGREAVVEIENLLVPPEPTLYSPKAENRLRLSQHDCPIPKAKGTPMLKAFS